MFYKHREPQPAFLHHTVTDTLSTNVVNGKGDVNTKELRTGQLLKGTLDDFPEQRDWFTSLISVLYFLEKEKGIEFKPLVIPDEKGFFPAFEMDYEGEKVMLSRFLPDNPWSKGHDDKGRPVFVFKLDVSALLPPGSDKGNEYVAYLIEVMNYMGESTRSILFSNRNMLHSIADGELRRFLTEASIKNCVWETFFSRKEKFRYGYHLEYNHHKFNHNVKGTFKDYEQAWANKIHSAIKKMIKATI